MIDNLIPALDHIIAAEGGFANHPRDPGGPTMRGVTQRVYEAWLKRPVTVDELKAIPLDVVEEIYTAQYANKIMFDQLPVGLDYCVLDTAVNSGTARAVKLLQAVIGMPASDQDGIMGAVTLAHLKQCDHNTDELVPLYCEARLRFMRSLATWGTFGKGWASRVQEVEDAATWMASGVESVPLERTTPPDAKAVGAVKLSRTKSGAVALASTVVAAGAGANQIVAALTPYADVPYVRTALIGLTCVASLGTMLVAVQRTQAGATT